MEKKENYILMLIHSLNFPPNAFIAYDIRINSRISPETSFFCQNKGYETSTEVHKWIHLEMDKGID